MPISANQGAVFLRIADQSMNAAIRPTTPTDIDPLVQLAERTLVFRPHEIEALREVLVDFFKLNQQYGHVAVTYETDGKILGFAYYAPNTMTDGTWALYWIAVSQQTQAKGIGGQLLRHTEDDVRTKKGRQLLIETSSLPHYELTRKFYLKHHYQQVAIVPDFYAEKDDMVIFRKKL